jgi:hypothetical protein
VSKPPLLIAIGSFSPRMAAAMLVFYNQRQAWSVNWTTLAQIFWYESPLGSQPRAVAVDTGFGNTLTRREP